jgi:hypothetical protein
VTDAVAAAPYGGSGVGDCLVRVARQVRLPASNHGARVAYTIDFDRR